MVFPAPLRMRDCCRKLFQDCRIGSPPLRVPWGKDFQLADDLIAICKWPRRERLMKEQPELECRIRQGEVDPAFRSSLFRGACLISSHIVKGFQIEDYPHFIVGYHFIAPFRQTAPFLPSFDGLIDQGQRIRSRRVHDFDLCRGKSETVLERSEV